METQNLYNTEVRMRCAGVSAPDVTLALNQQRAFFAYLRDGTAAARLDALTREARGKPALADWLFPDSASTDRTGGAWYVVLDPDFDPAPVWRRYRGHAVFVFSEHDDSTPTAAARRRLQGGRMETRVLDGAQHLGLSANDVCQGELADTTGFSPDLFRHLARFARASR